MTIYDIPSIIKIAMPVALTQANIQAGFRNTGIFPFNRDIFQEVDFAPSLVTDRPNPNTLEEAAVPNVQIALTPDGQSHQLPRATLNPHSSNAACSDEPEGRAAPNQTVVSHSLLDEDSTLTNPGNGSVIHTESSAILQISQLTTPPKQTAGEANQEQSEAVIPSLEPNRFSCDAALHQNSEPIPSTSKQIVFSPEAVRPYPKAPPRKPGTRGRNTKKSQIYTDTPVKEAVRQEYEDRQKPLTLCRPPVSQ
nr:unnamed protein product [Callosobruchus chinensis]